MEGVSRINQTFQYYRENCFMTDPQFTFDWFVMSIINGVQSLNEAFDILADQQNYFCAIPMIRQQIDNCLILYAGLVCDDMDKFFASYSAGSDINKLECKGEKLTTRYLYEHLEDYLGEGFEGLSAIYVRTCKFIHPSVAQFNASFKSTTPDILQIKGWKNALPIYYSKENVYSDMMLANLAINNILKAWIETKMVYAEKIKNQELVKLPFSISDKRSIQKTIDCLMGNNAVSIKIGNVVLHNSDPKRLWLVIKSEPNEETCRVKELTTADEDPMILDYKKDELTVME